jgi:xanthine/uracil permease
MRKNLFIGSLIAAVLILSVPMVSAVEWKSVEKKISEVEVQNLSLKEILKNNDQNPQPSCIIMILTVLIMFLKFVRFIRQTFKISEILLGLIVLYILAHFYG